MIPATFAYLQIGWFRLLLPLFILTVPFMVLVPIILIIYALLLPTNSKKYLRLMKQMITFYTVLGHLHNVNIYVNARDEETNKKTKFVLYVL